MTPQLKEAIELFNRGDYFAASERFEQAASELDAQLKETVLALNRIAAALFSLEDLGPQHAGIDLERLRSEISACVEQIRSTGRTAHGLKYRAQLFVARRRAPKIRLRT
jgi:hypothetical protein